MSDYRGSSPPSPIPPPPSPTPVRQPSGVFALDDPSGEATHYHARRGARIAVEVRTTVGELPNPLAGFPGSGLSRMIGEMRTDLGRVVAWMEAEQASRGSAAGVASRLGWIVLQTLTTAGVLALIAWLAGFHR